MDPFWRSRRLVCVPRAGAGAHAAKPRSRKLKHGKRKYVRAACAVCVKAKTSCSDERPCARCTRLGRAHLCVDVAPSGNASTAVVPRRIQPPEIEVVGPGGTFVVRDGWAEQVLMKKPREQARGAAGDIAAGGLRVVCSEDPTFAEVVSPETLTMSELTMECRLTARDEVTLKDAAALDEIMDNVIKASPIPATRMTFSPVTFEMHRCVMNAAAIRLVGVNSAYARASVSNLDDVVACIHPEDRAAMMEELGMAMINRTSSAVFGPHRFLQMGAELDSPQRVFSCKHMTQFEYFDAGMPRSITTYMTDARFTGEVLTPEEIKSLEAKFGAAHPDMDGLRDTVHDGVTSAAATASTDGASAPSSTASSSSGSTAGSVPSPRSNSRNASSASETGASPLSGEDLDQLEELAASGTATTDAYTNGESVEDLAADLMDPFCVDVGEGELEMSRPVDAAMLDSFDFDLEVPARAAGLA